MNLEPDNSNIVNLKDLDLEELYFYNKANKINYKQDKYQSRAPIFFSSEARINPFNINSNKNEY